MAIAITKQQAQDIAKQKLKEIDYSTLDGIYNAIEMAANNGEFEISFYINDNKLGEVTNSLRENGFEFKIQVGNLNPFDPQANISIRWDDYKYRNYGWNFDGYAM